MSVLTEIDEYLMHYGMPKRSGRYPWGSGEDPYQHTGDFLSRVEELKKSGWEETSENIKKEFGMSTTQYRAEKSLAKNERRALKVATAKSLKEDGLQPTEIARRLSEQYGENISESTVRGYFNEKAEARMNQAKETADFLRTQVDNKRIIEVGLGVERELNIPREKFDQAIGLLETEGYKKYGLRVDQVNNPGQKTTIKVLCQPDVDHAYVYNHLDEIESTNDYITRDNGKTYEKKFTYPTSIDSSRVKILLADEVGPEGTTGKQKDGLIELRRGVEDLSLGESRYSQVRILVDGNKYLKGMAVYSDNLPDGIDVLFNSNKTTVEDGYKKIKDDPENPFGSTIKDADQGGQYWYTDSKTGEKKLGAINKRSDEGDWKDWQDALPSQFLGKQSLQMAKKQLALAEAQKQEEFDAINELTQPTVKKYLLSKFADECDAAAVNLQAAALPGQKYHVIIPVAEMKDTEVYAPQYENGTQLALIRYPHGGTFEIPIVTVNNKNKIAREVIGTESIDAIGINKNVADRLSGADFDGDTVMCIPTHDKQGKVKVTSTPELQGLKGFDPNQYEYDKHVPASQSSDGEEHYYRNGVEFKIMSKQYTQKQMGVISNLITDMTLIGAEPDELAAAVRHSMVVIDANKHKLDYKQSELDNNIAALKAKYQISYDEDGNLHIGGASTLLSRAKGEATVSKRQGEPVANTKTRNGKPNPDYDPSRPEGALIYKKAADKDLYYTVTEVDKKTGEVTEKRIERTQKSTRMAETDDAATLISDAQTQMEKQYASYANYMKNLANKARIEIEDTGKVAYSPTANKEYAEEVASLDEKLNTALLNAPRERMATIKSAAAVQKKKAEAKETGEEVTKSDLKKLGQQTLTKYRDEYSSVSRKERSVAITDREWEAITKGAITENKLTKLLNNSDIDVLRERATPKATSSALQKSQINLIKRYAASNYTAEEIASKLGVSPSTVYKYVKGKE